MTTLTTIFRLGSAQIAAAIWLAALACLAFGFDSGIYALVLAAAVGATAVAAIDRHAAQLAEVAALSYRAGTAARDRRDTAA